MTRYFPLYVFPTRILSDFWDDDALHLMQLRKDKKIGLIDEPTEWCSQNGCESGHACCIAADGSLSSSFELGTGDVDKWRTQCTTPTPTKVGGCNAYVPGLPFEFPCADEWDATAPFSKTGGEANLKNSGAPIIKGCSRIGQWTNHWGAWCMTKYKYPEWGHPTWSYMHGAMVLNPSAKELDGNTSFANRLMLPCKPECPGYVAPGDYTGQPLNGGKQWSPDVGTLAPTGDKFNCPKGVCFCEAANFNVWNTFWGNYLHWWQHGTSLYVKTKKGDFVHAWHARDPSRLTNLSVYSPGFSDGNLKSLDVNKQVGLDGTRLDSYGYSGNMRNFAISGKLNGHVFVSIDTTAWNAWHKKLGFKLGGGYPFPYKHRIDDACFTAGGWCRVKCDDPSEMLALDGGPLPKGLKYDCVKYQWLSADGKIGLRKGYYTPAGGQWKGSAYHWYLFDPEDPEAIKIQITDSSTLQVTIREDFVENDGMCANKYPPAFHMPNQPSPGEPIPYEDWVLSEAEAKALCDFTKWGDPTKGECQPLKAPQPVTWEGGPDLPVVAQAEEPNKFCVVPTTTTTTTEDTGHVCKHYEAEDSCPDARCSRDGPACPEPPCSSHASKGECCGDCEWQQGRCQPAMFKACPKEGKPGTNKCPKGCTFVDNCEQCEFAAGVWKKDFSKEPWAPRSGSRPQGCFRNRKFNIKCNKFEPGSKYSSGVNKVGTKRGKWPICKIIEPPKKC